MKVSKITKNVPLSLKIEKVVVGQRSVSFRCLGTYLSNKAPSSPISGGETTWSNIMYAEVEVEKDEVVSGRFKSHDGTDGNWVPLFDESKGGVENLTKSFARMFKEAIKTFGINDIYSGDCFFRHISDD